MSNMRFYKTFSINLHRFFKANSFKHLSKGIHENGKTFWVYELDEAGKLSELLKIWSEKKKTDYK